MWNENNIPKNRYSKIRHEFLDRYNKELLPFLLNFENERKSVLRNAIISVIFLGILAVGVIILTFYLIHIGERLPRDWGYVIGFVVSLPFFAWQWFKKRFESKIKQRIMPSVCTCFGDMHWTEKECDKGSFIVSSGVVQPYSSESYDDIFHGSWDGVNIDIIESEYTRGGGKNRVRLFDGVVVILDMNKHFSGHTVIKTKRIMDNRSPFKHLTEIKLEDTAFNNTYNVYSTDEVEARYLITPSFMERLKKMKMAFSADRVICSFFDKYLLVGLVTGKDLFSICDITKPMNDSKQYFQMFEEILSIIKLIDHFKLNQHIGL